MKTFGIIGCGWLGEKLASTINKEYKLFVTSRSEERVSQLKSRGFEVTKVDFLDSVGFNDTFNGADVLFVALTFPKTNPGLWLDNLQKFIGNYTNPIYLCSSTGIYPNCEKTFTEEDIIDLDLDFLHIESFLHKAYPQLNVLRLGGLMGDERYLSKWFLNRPLSKPGARINYIHYQDILGIVKKMLELDISAKTYNVVSPQHPRKNEVFFAQKGIYVEAEIEFNRIISSELLIKEIGYTFVYPNPSEFPFIKA